MRVAVCLSGRGSNLGALLAGLSPGSDPEVVVVISNRESAGGLEIARNHGIPTVVLNDSADPIEWIAVLDTWRTDLIVLAGFLKQVPDVVVARYDGRMLNIHPSLLPRHGGAGMYGLRVHRAVLEAGDGESGATVHLVTAQYDEGPVLGQARVEVRPDDTPETLAGRVLEIEHRLLPAAVRAAGHAGRPVSFTLDD